MSKRPNSELMTQVAYHALCLARSPTSTLKYIATYVVGQTQVNLLLRPGGAGMVKGSQALRREDHSAAHQNQG